MTANTYHHQWVVDERSHKMRLDKYLSTQLDLSRSKLQKLIEAEAVKIDGDGTKNCAAKVLSGQTVTLDYERQSQTADIVPTEIPLDIIYEDEALLVINKPVGLTVHPAPGHLDDTLVNALMAYCGDTLSAIGGDARPGIVHRLDKDTSGLIVVAKDDHTHSKLASQLADRSLSRTYQALVWGIPSPSSGVIDAPIARHPKDRKKMAVVEPGRESRTHYRLLESFAQGTITRVECKLETGRTHQIRVHMQHIGHPLIGDTLYGGRQRAAKQSLSPARRDMLHSFPRQALHACALGLIHPNTGEEMSWTVPLPSDMKTLIENLKS